MISYMKWILAPAIAIVMMGTIDANSAKADFGLFTGRGLSISIGTSYPPVRSYYGYSPSYRSIYGHSIVSPYRSRYSSGHYHYHPAEVIRHGSHYHMVPGHFDYYPGGHGHRGHRGSHGHH